MENSEPLMPLWAAIPFSIYVAVIFLGLIIFASYVTSSSNQSSGSRQKDRAQNFITFLCILVWPVFAIWYLPLGIKNAAIGIVQWTKDITAGLKQIRREHNAKN